MISIEVIGKEGHFLRVVLLAANIPNCCDLIESVSTLLGFCVLKKMKNGKNVDYHSAHSHCRFRFLCFHVLMQAMV